MYKNISPEDCFHCQEFKKFKKLNNLMKHRYEQHMKDHIDNSKKFDCDKCGTVITLRNLNTHKNSKLCIFFDKFDDSKVKCTVCDEIINKKLMSRHSEKCHSSVTKIECNRCGKNVFNITVHQETDLSCKNFKSFCNGKITCLKCNVVINKNFSSIKKHLNSEFHILGYPYIPKNHISNFQTEDKNNIDHIFDL